MNYNYGYTNEAVASSPIMSLLSLAIMVYYAFVMWKVFEKAGVPGWKSLIPFYNQWILFELCGYKGAYIFFMFIPCVGIFIYLYFYIMVLINLAKSFGKEPVFAVGLLLVNVVFFSILAFDDSKFTKLSNTNNAVNPNV